MHVIIDQELPLDEIVFADTGAEKPDTYAYLEKWIKPFLSDMGVRFVTVRAKETLLERCLRGHTIPDRRYRWSTRDYKIRPIYKHLKAYAPVVCYLGIAFDEIHRVKQENSVSWILRDWPLIDRKMNRADCVKLIESKGWPVPVKSGCWFCPFSSLADWNRLWKSQPDLYEKAVAIEKNGSKYPRFTLVEGGLERLRDRFVREEKAAREQSSLDLYQDECSGYCFT